MDVFSEMYLAFSTASGSQAGDSSPFAAAFLQHLVTPGLELDLLFRQVRKEVIDGTRGRQIPWSSNSLKNAFYFVPPRPPPPPPPQSATGAPTGSVTVRTNPPGMLARLGDRDLGPTPVSLELAPGNQPITVTGPCHESITQDVVVVAYANQIVELAPRRLSRNILLNVTDEAGAPIDRFWVTVDGVSADVENSSVWVDQCAQTIAVSALRRLRDMRLINPPTQRTLDVKLLPDDRAGLSAAPFHLRVGIVSDPSKTSGADALVTYGGLISGAIGSSLFTPALLLDMEAGYGGGFVGNVDFMFGLAFIPSPHFRLQLTPGLGVSGIYGRIPVGFELMTELRAHAHAFGWFIVEAYARPVWVPATAEARRLGFSSSFFDEFSWGVWVTPFFFPRFDDTIMEQGLMFTFDSTVTMSTTVLRFGLGWGWGV